jgi:putative oxidoreductase
MNTAKKWNVGLWILQALLGALFFMAGYSKVSTPVADLAAQMSWVNHYSESMVRFIGAAEIAGGIGLVLPTATRVLPVLTPAAAAALAILMGLAAEYHLDHDEASLIGVNIVLGGLALLICWGRLKKAPVEKRF